MMQYSLNSKTTKRRGMITLLLLCIVTLATSSPSWNERVEAFRQWFVEGGGEVSGLDVEDFKEMGRGIVAKREISPNEEVLFIPSSMIISAKRIRSSDDVDHQQISKLFSDEQELVTAFILLERAKGESSFWKPYFDVLPDYVPNLGHCGAEELDELQHPPFSNEVKRVNRKTRSSFQNFLIKTNEMWPSSVAATELDYLWAASIVDSRAFRFKGSINLAPFSDMFNYEPHAQERQANAGNFFLKHHKLTSAGLYVTSDRSCAAGNQLFEDYGDNMDKIYIQYHGFVPDKNPFRCVHLNPMPLGSIPRAQQRSNTADEIKGVRELLDLMEFRQTPSMCVNSKGALGQSIEVYITVLALNDSELADCFDVVNLSNKNWAMVFDMCGFKDVSSYLGQLRLEGHDRRKKMITQEKADRSLRGRVLEKIEAMIIEREKLFETTESEDEDLLRRLGAELKKQGNHSAGPTSPAGQILRQMNIIRYRYFNKKHVAYLKQFYQGIVHHDSEADIVSRDIDEEKIEAAALAAASDNVLNLTMQWSLNEQPGRDDRLTVDLQKFNEWFRSAITPPSVCKIEAKVIPGYRIGTVVTEDVNEEDIYLTVPKKMILDVDYVNSGRADPAFRQMLQDLEDKFGRRDDFHELLFLLLYEGFVKGSSSFFWPYLRTIPSISDLDVPLVWSEDDIRKRLRPSHLERGQLEHKAQVKSFYKSISQIDIVNNFFPNGVFTEQNYVWATAILDSRSIWWGGQRHIVPMLDFVNCNEKISDDGPLGRIHATTWGPIPGASGNMEEYALTKSAWKLMKGDQLFENYGQPNHIYYTYHGFVLPNSVYDCVHFEISLTKEEQEKIDFSKASKLIRMLNLRRRKNDPGVPPVQFCLKEDSGVLDIPGHVWVYLALKLNIFQTMKENSYERPHPKSERFLFEMVQDQIKRYDEADLHDTKHLTSVHFKKLERDILFKWSKNVESSIFSDKDEL